jgi:hypothetical protein
VALILFLLLTGTSFDFAVALKGMGR